MSEVKKVDPFVYWADCEDPDQSSMCWHKEDALTQINDHGGTLHELSHTSELTAAQSELAALREELAKTYRTASELASAMTRDVADLSPEFGLFDYACGVIGQIDNMYTGMRSDRNALKQRLAAAEQRNAVQRGLLHRALNIIRGMRYDELETAIVEELNIKPTESGASE